MNKAKEYLGYAKAGVRRFFKEDYQLPLSFAIPFFILLVAYCCFGVFPFGKSSVLSLDLNGQYVYYYDYMYDVLAGKESIFYSWSRNLSGEFMGIIGYYLGSPFNYLVWMFPRSMITEGLLTMMVVKVGSIGLACACYLNRGRGYGRMTTIIFSSCYALCAYTIVQTMNPMWLDGVLALPLVVYGIEKLLDEGKFRLYTIALAYSFITCFYIGFMMAIFSVIYFFYYMAVTLDRNKAKRLFGRCVLYGVSSLTAAAISAFMLIPVYFSLSNGKFTFSEPDYSSVYTNFDIASLAEKLFPNTYDTVRMSGLPFLYCGIAALLFLPAYFFMKKINGRERIASAAVLLVMGTCMLICQVDMIWHGGQLPNWLPYRYSFMVSFLMISMAARAFDNLRDIPKSVIAKTAVALGAILVYIESTDTYLEDISCDTMDTLQVILPAILAVLVVSAVFVQLKDKIFTKKSACVVMVLFVGLELFFNTMGQIVKQNCDIVYSTRGSYVDVIVPTREVVEEIKAKDDGFYRTEKLYFRTVNDPMALNMYGLSHSSSTLNSKPIEMLSRLGFTSRSHYTRYSGATLITSSLFGVKYILETEDNKTSDIQSKDDITVTTNEYALPICYLVDSGFTEYSQIQNDPFTNQNRLLSAMLGQEDYEYFKRIYDTEFETENVTQGSTTDSHHSFKVKTSGRNAEIVYTIEMPEKSDLFVYFPTRYERKVNLWLNRSEFLGTYFEGDELYLRNIGSFEKGEEVVLGLTLTKDELYFREAQFCTLDEERAKADLQKLLDLNADTSVEKVNSQHIRITTDCPEDKLLLTTIPVEEGWTVYVDGAETEYTEAMDALIAVPLTAGSHTVELVFVTAGYPLAVIITIAGVIIFAAMWIVYVKCFAKKKKKAAADGTLAEMSLADMAEIADSDDAFEISEDNEDGTCD